MNWRGTLRQSFVFLAVAGLGFMLAYLVAAFVVFPSGGVIPEDATVPAVTGLSIDAATTELRRAGFQPREGETRFHASAPRGTVLEQTPAAGSKELTGTAVTLAVSGGQQSQPVPNVVGLLREDAEAALVDAGFDVGAVEDRASQQPLGEVLDTRPRPGASAAVPSSVALVVSSGPNLTAVPDLVGLGVTQARSLLAANGLVAGDVAYDYAPGATVIVSQSPAAGTRVGPRTAVALRASGEIAP